MGPSPTRSFSATLVDSPESKILILSWTKSGTRKFIIYESLCVQNALIIEPFSAHHILTGILQAMKSSFVNIIKERRKGSKVVVELSSLVGFCFPWLSRWIRGTITACLPHLYVSVIVGQFFAFEHVRHCCGVRYSSGARMWGDLKREIDCVIRLG